MGKTFVIGDIHGAYHALEQCLERSEFDPVNDTLICLGDVCDGWPQTRQCVDKLLQIKNLVYLLGNHDLWALNWMESGIAEDIWLTQGGVATCESYADGVPIAHRSFLQNARSYYIDRNRLFVHAGILPGKRPEECSLNVLLWDRTLARMAYENSLKGLEGGLTEFEEVFIGHTPITSPKPVKCCEVWMMDTGAGWTGVLSMMDLDNYAFYVSDPVPLLYPGLPGRKRI